MNEIICARCGAKVERTRTNQGLPIRDLSEQYKTYCPNGCAYGLSKGSYGMSDEKFVENSKISLKKHGIREVKGG